MKQIKITILAELDEDIVESFKAEGNTDKGILGIIKKTFNSAKNLTGLIQDFQVENVEVTK